MDLNSARSVLRYPPAIEFSQIAAEQVVIMCIAGGFLLLLG